MCALRALCPFYFMKFKAITENHLYDKTFNRGKRGVARTVAVHVLPDRHAFILMKANPQKKKLNRIGLSVGKKVGGAVVRNRAKRIIREAYRQLDRESAIPRGNLIVLAARPDIVGKKMGEVKADMKYCMKRAELIGQPPSTKK